MKILIIALALLTSAQVYAGADAGGGGSLIETAFRRTAADLINTVSKHEAANKLCNANIIEAGLNSSKVKVVDTLINLNTGKPITEQHFDAWTQPGTIQLKRMTWLKYLKGKDIFDEDIYTLILHELYRTTTACDDDTGALSTTVAKLLKSPSVPVSNEKLKRLYAFKYLATNWERVQPLTEKSYTNSGMKNRFLVDEIICEKPVDFLNAEPGVRCLMIGFNQYQGSGRHGEWYDERHDTLRAIIIQTQSNRSYSRIVYTSDLSCKGKVYDRVNYNYTGLLNLIKYVSEAQPFYVMVYLTNGSVNMSYDLNEL